LSLNNDESIFGETEKILSEMKKPRNRYINEAIDYSRLIRKVDDLPVSLADKVQENININLDLK